MLWKKRLQSCIIGLIPVVLGKEWIYQQQKTLENLYSNAKNLYIIKEDIINEMSNTEDEKLDIVTGGYDDRRKSGIEIILRFGDTEEPETGKGLKIMTPKQMITRLPIFIAQKQAGNNSQKLNN